MFILPRICYQWPNMRKSITAYFGLSFKFESGHYTSGCYIQYNSRFTLMPSSTGPSFVASGRYFARLVWLGKVGILNVYKAYKQCLSDKLLSLYRVIQGERSIFWEVIVSVIVRKKFILTCVQVWMVTEIELFESPDSTPLDFLFVRLDEERSLK
jgi:hypothetical protein